MEWPKHQFLLLRDKATPYNSDLRDSHEYTQKQVWGERILQGEVAGGLMETTNKCSIIHLTLHI